MSVLKKNSILKSCLQLYLPIFIIGVIWDRLSGYNYTDSFFRINFTNLGIGILIGVGLVIFTYISLLIIPSLKRMETFFKDIIGDINLGTIFALAFLSSFAEEILFRGVLLHYTGFWISSIIFGLLHFPVKKFLVPWTVFAHLKSKKQKMEIQYIPVLHLLHPEIYICC